MIDKFIDVYENKQEHHKKIMSHDEAVKYYRYMMNLNRINYLFEEEELVGFIESYRLNSDQMFKLTSNKLCIYDEDICSGNFLYITDYWTRSRDRECIVSVLNQDLYDNNNDFKILAWDRDSKKDKGIRTMKRDKALETWGIDHG